MYVVVSKNLAYGPFYTKASAQQYIEACFCGGSKLFCSVVELEEPISSFTDLELIDP